MTQAPKNALHKKRDQLDSIDRDLIQVLSERLDCVRDIAQIKQGEGKAVRDSKREHELLDKIAQIAERKGLSVSYVKNLYQQILDHSVDCQRIEIHSKNSLSDTREINCGYQGEPGSYSQLAWTHLKSTVSSESEGNETSFQSFDQLIHSLDQGDIQYAILPVENKVTGNIHSALDPLVRSNVQIIGEHYLTVRHCLMISPKNTKKLIRKIYSHPQALGQCTRFINSLGDCEQVSDTDTARAARRIAENPDKPWAAIGSERAANIYGLSVIHQDIADLNENWTRFLLLSKKPSPLTGRGPWKTSLLLGVPERQGVPLSALNTLEQSGIQVHNVTPRPHPSHPRQSVFLLTCDGHTSQEHWQQALKDLSAQVTFLKLFGSYPANGLREPAVKTLGPKPAAKKPSPPRKPSSSSAHTLSDSVAAFLKTKKYTLASRLSSDSDRIVSVGGVPVGGNHRCVIAGPCSVESRHQIWSIAEHISKQGAQILRGGCFKPRTSPYDFQGLGYKGLEYLKEAGEHFGMPVVTEVMESSEIRRVSEIADMIQIGARNMQNFPLLKEAGKINKPVMLKRGLNATIDEWLNAAEYILSEGNMQVILCERGIRTFETATRSTLDLSAVPVLKERTHLPVIVDPSHASGVWQYINDLSVAAMAVGSHAVMVEVHPNPSEALSDGPQALTFPVFEDLMERLTPWTHQEAKTYDQTIRA